MMHHRFFPQFDCFWFAEGETRDATKRLTSKKGKTFCHKCVFILLFFNTSTFAETRGKGPRRHRDNPSCG